MYYIHRIIINQLVCSQWIYVSACGKGDKKSFSDYFHVTLERNLHNGVFFTRAHFPFIHKHVIFFCVSNLTNFLHSLVIALSDCHFFSSFARKMYSFNFTRINLKKRDFLCLMKYGTNLSLISRAYDVEWRRFTDSLEMIKFSFPIIRF